MLLWIGEAYDTHNLVIHLFRSRRKPRSKSSEGMRGYELPNPPIRAEEGVPNTWGLLKSISLVSNLDEDSTPPAGGPNDGAGMGDFPITPGDDEARKQHNAQIDRREFQIPISATTEENPKTND